MHVIGDAQWRHGGILGAPTVSRVRFCGQRKFTFGGMRRCGADDVGGMGGFSGCGGMILGCSFSHQLRFGCAICPMWMVYGSCHRLRLELVARDFQRG